VIVSTSPHQGSRTDVRSLPPDAPNTDVVLPDNPTLHDISQSYLDAYCKLLGKQTPALMRDGWDKGVTASGVGEVVAAVLARELNRRDAPVEKPARLLLQRWAAALREKLLELKTTDGCSGGFGRHENSKAIEGHLSATLKGLRSVKVESLLKAAADADRGALQKWIQDGADINTRDDGGNTALLLLLRNQSMDGDMRSKVDECVAYLLTVPGIEVHAPAPLGEGLGSANALGLAIRHGREAIARRLMTDYPDMAFRGDEGDTIASCAARHCPELVSDLISRFDGNGRALAAMYKQEMATVGLNYRQGSRAFICRALNEICRGNVEDGREEMKDLVIAATALKDTEMITAAIREWHCQPAVFTANR
jgi:hypothetical protein